MKLQELKSKIYQLKTLPEMSFGHWSVIDPKKFVRHSIHCLETNSGNYRYIPMYYRLLKYYEQAAKHPSNVND